MRSSHESFITEENSSAKETRGVRLGFLLGACFRFADTTGHGNLGLGRLGMLFVFLSWAVHEARLRPEKQSELWLKNKKPVTAHYMCIPYTATGSN